MYLVPANVFDRAILQKQPTDFKDALSGLRQVLLMERPLKIIKNDFYFTFKALFYLKIYKFLQGK